MPSPVFVNSRSPIPVQAERMAVLEERMARLDRQVSTGDRLVDPSDDPSGANRAALLARQDTRLAADAKAVDRNASRLTAAESAIKAATDALLRARDLALSAANGTLSAEDRIAIAREVSVLQVQLLDSANARDESGRYLFAGSRGGAPAYALDADGLAVWQGMDVASGAEAAGLQGLGPPRGVALFGDDAGGSFAQLEALRKALLEPDAEKRNAALADVLQGLEVGRNRLIDGRSAVGADLARLEAEGNRIADTRLSVAEALAAVRGVDLTAAFAELSALQLSLSAAQGSFSRIYDGSLFDRLG